MITRLLLISLLTAGFSVAAIATEDQQVEARRMALELAGAFANDGFKLRDGHWSGEIKTGQAKIVLVNLYAGNEYWFSVAAGPQAKKVSVKVYNEQGALVESDPYQENATAAAGFTAAASGPYFIKIEELEGDASSFCLVYSYK